MGWLVWRLLVRCVFCEVKAVGYVDSLA